MVFIIFICVKWCVLYSVEMWWHTVTHGRGSEGGNWQMEWVASTLHTTLEHGVSSITTADAHTSAASSRLKWHPCRFKQARPFRQKTKSGFCACAITFQLASNTPFDNPAECICHTVTTCWQNIWMLLALTRHIKRNCYQITTNEYVWMNAVQYQILIHFT